MRALTWPSLGLSGKSKAARAGAAKRLGAKCKAGKNFRAYYHYQGLGGVNLILKLRAPLKLELLYGVYSLGLMGQGSKCQVFRI